MWREKWEAAQKKAQFFSSEKNTAGYWDSCAVHSNESMIIDKRLTDILLSELQSRKLLSKDTTVLDAGCGTGEFSIALSQEVGSVCALDYSQKMIDISKKKAAGKGISNIEFITEDINKYSPDKKYDIVLALLNPGVYSPAGFDKLSSLAEKAVCCFSQEGDVEASSEEKIYAGSHLADYPYNYAKEIGMKAEKIPFVYTMTDSERNERKINFSFVLCTR